MDGEPQEAEPLAPAQPSVDVDELAGAISARIPQPDVDGHALKVADALAKRAADKGARWVTLASRRVRLIAKRLGARIDSLQTSLVQRDARLDAVDSGLGALHGSFSQTGTRLEELGARLDADEARRRRDHRTLVRVAWATCAVGAVTAAAVAALLLLGRSQTQAAPPVIVVTNFGGTLFGLDLRAIDELDEQMGQKQSFQNQDIPLSPFPGQKTPPCLPEAGEEEINGGCWQSTTVKPPCGILFRKAGACYRVIKATPRQPESLNEWPAPPPPHRP